MTDRPMVSDGAPSVNPGGLILSVFLRNEQNPDRPSPNQTRESFVSTGTRDRPGPFDCSFDPLNDLFGPSIDLSEPSIVHFGPSNDPFDPSIVLIGVSNVRFGPSIVLSEAPIDLPEPSIVHFGPSNVRFGPSIVPSGASIDLPGPSIVTLVDSVDPRAINRRSGMINR